MEANNRLNRLSDKERNGLISAYIELIVLLYNKLNTQDPKYDSILQQEIATNILNIARVRMPNGRNIDTEIIEVLVENVMQKFHKKPSIQKIADFIKLQYQNVIFDDKHTDNDIIKDLKEIC